MTEQLTKKIRENIENIVIAFLDENPEVIIKPNTLSKEGYDKLMNYAGFHYCEKTKIALNLEHFDKALKKLGCKVKYN